MTAIRIGVAGPRLLGPEPRAQLRRAAPAASSPGCATPIRRRSRASAPRSRPRAGPPRWTTCSPTRSSTPSCSPRRCPRTRSSPSACCARASTASSRSRSPSRSPTPSAPSRRRRQPGRTLMVGHLLEYHPGVASSSGSPTRGELGEIHYIYSNRLNLGQAAGRRERAVVARRARRVRRAPPRRGGALRGRGPRRVLHAPRDRGRRVRLPALPVRARRAPAPVVAGPAQGAALHRRRLAAGWRRSTTWTSSARSPSTTRASTRTPAPTASTSRARATSGARASPTASRCGWSASTSSTCVRDGRAPRSDGAAGLRVVRVLAALQERLDASRRVQRCGRLTARPGLVLGDGVRLGEGVRLGAHVVIHAGHGARRRLRVQDDAVLGKPPALARHSTAARGAPGAARARAGRGRLRGRGRVRGRATSATGAILGDQAYVRERARIGARHRDRARRLRRQRRRGRRARARADRRLPDGALGRVEDDVFVGPGATTTNDDTMARHGPEYALRGATLRRACRIGGGAVLCPASRSARRRSWRPARSSRATSRRARWSWACRRAWSARSATRTCSSAGASVRGMSEHPRRPQRPHLGRSARRRRGSGATAAETRAARRARGPGSRRRPARRLTPSPSGTRPAAARRAAGRAQPRLHQRAAPRRSGASRPRTPRCCARYTLSGWWSRVGAALIDGLIIVRRRRS